MYLHALRKRNARESIDLIYVTRDIFIFEIPRVLNSNKLSGFNDADLNFDSFPIQLARENLR